MREKKEGREEEEGGGDSGVAAWQHQAQREMSTAARPEDWVVLGGKASRGASSQLIEAG